MSESPADFNWDEWWDLRAIVLDAAAGQPSQLYEKYRGNPIADAAAARLAIRNESTNSDFEAAAKALAKMKPGVDAAINESHYWLVLEKS
jgi:hypothetical protein